MRFVNDVAAKAKVFLRERKDRAAERKAAKELARAQLPGNAVPALWVWFLGSIAVCTLLGSTWMLAVFIAGSVGHIDWAFDWRAGNDGAPARWQWSAEARIHALIGVGLALACAGVAMYNAVWLHVREHIRSILFRRVITAIGVAVAFFMVSGAIVTQQWGTDARTRDEVSAERTAQAGVAAVDAEIASIETEMARLCASNLTTWQAQACRSGEQAWADRIQIARGQMRGTDPQFQIIARAIADARQGDRWRARLTDLRRERASAAVTTVQASVAEVRAVGWFAEFTHFLEDIRKPFIAVLGELLAMTMFGVALEAHRSRQPYRVHPKNSGWADDGFQIEDKTAEDAIVPQPMKPPREVVTDAETGEEMVRVKPHWRKLKKGRPQQVDIIPEPQPDETGVAPELDGGDGGLRSAGAPSDDAPQTDAGHVGEPQASSGAQQSQTDESVSQDDLSDDDAAALNALAEDAGDEPVEPAPMIDAEPDGVEDRGENQQSEHSPPPEPEPQADDGGHDDGGGDAGQGEVSKHDEPQPETREDRLLEAPQIAAE